MTYSEAIEELKYDCNELGKAIPCDTSWGCSFENAYEMAISALERQNPSGIIEYGICPVCKHDFGMYKANYCPNCGQRLYIKYKESEE